MTTETKTIPANQDSVTFDLGIGSYNLTAAAGKFISITRDFDITESDLSNGSKLIDLGAMEMGTHTFNVSINADDTGEFTVTLYKGADVIETTTTVNHAASFEVTADNHESSADSYIITVERSGYLTTTTEVEATMAQFRLGGSADVSVNAGRNTVTLTVKVYAPAIVDVEVD